MQLNTTENEEKPYNKCLTCEHLGTNCDGPNFLAMSSERWSEWMKMRKEHLGWTNAKVAEASDISLPSINRALSGNTKDIRVTTMQSITKALVNGSWGMYPCAMSTAEQQTITIDNPDIIKDNELLKKEIEMHKEHIAVLNKEIDAKNVLMKERYDFLKRKDRIIYFLSSSVAVLLLICIYGAYF